MKSLQSSVKIAPLVLGIALFSAAVLKVTAIQYSASVAPLNLAIPSGGFSSDVTVNVTMTVSVYKNWNDHMYFHDYTFSIWDDDPLFDDLLITTSGFLTPMIEFGTTAVTTTIQVDLPVNALNDAIDFLEGNYLELILTGFTPSIFVDKDDDRIVDDGEQVDVPDSGPGSLPVCAILALLLLARNSWIRPA